MFFCQRLSPPPSLIHISISLSVPSVMSYNYTDPRPPGPGSYSPDKAIFGPTLLKEGGGAVTRPGKLCHSTSAAEGRINGQHASVLSSTPHYTPLSETTKLVSVVKVHRDTQGDRIAGEGQRGGKRTTLIAKWRSTGAAFSAPGRSNHHEVQKKEGLSQYAFPKKKVPLTCRHIGRNTETSVPERNCIFRGRNSPGTFLRFEPSTE